MLKSIPSKLFRRYAWAINSEAELPRGTVFPKRKKQFQKGRTIISYAGSLCSKLLQLASIVITIMTRTLYPDAPGLQSMPQLWRSLHRHWSKRSSEPDQEWNDDLVGFFYCSASSGHNTHCRCADRTIFETIGLYSPVGRLVVQVRPSGKTQREDMFFV